MKAIHRIKQYIDYKGLNNSSFEKKNNLSNGYIGTQLKRESDLGEGVLNKILDNCLDINPVWLLTGDGEMLKSNDDLTDIALIDAIRMQKKLNVAEKKIKILIELNEFYREEIEELKQEIKQLEKKINT
ncbi:MULTISPECIES: hypothetical protein [Apibacter]|uniref:hypothetical protein n=1 Tax=Apibacter TaxID=1778601 RepID=UPI00162713E5|nr:MULTISPECIES: hypothetical protein [Apibacter]MCX8676449.1 hypothetical protein [Apibacter sp. B3919]